MFLVNNDFRHDSCPFCNSSNVWRLGDIGYGRSICFSTTQIALKKTAELWRCRDCMSGFTQNAIQPIDMAELYATSQSSLRWVSPPFVQSKMPEVVGALGGILFDGAKVVDVGCNTGEFLDFARDMGCATMGVELSKESRAVICKKGHFVAESLHGLEDQSVDVVTAYDLVEHLYDIDDFFSLCAKKLKRGGCLVVLTGNVNCISAQMAGANWWYCRYPEHILFPSLEYFRSRSDFCCVDVLQTYAAKGYRAGIIKGFLGVLLRLLFFRYKGLPSLGADHCLYILQKT